MVAEELICQSTPLDIGGIVNVSALIHNRSSSNGGNCMNSFLPEHMKELSFNWLGCTKKFFCYREAADVPRYWQCLSILQYNITVHFLHEKVNISKFNFFDLLSSQLSAWQNQKNGIGGGFVPHPNFIPNSLHPGATLSIVQCCLQHSGCSSIIQSIWEQCLLSFWMLKNGFSGTLCVKSTLTPVFFNDRQWEANTTPKKQWKSKHCYTKEAVIVQTLQK